DWNRMIAVIDNWVPPARRDTVRALAREVDDTISGFVRGQTALCLVLAIYYAIALWLIGLKHGVVIGFAAGLLNFISHLRSPSRRARSSCARFLGARPGGGPDAVSGVPGASRRGVPPRQRAHPPLKPLHHPHP